MFETVPVQEVWPSRVTFPMLKERHYGAIRHLLVQSRTASSQKVRLRLYGTV